MITVNGRAREVAAGTTLTDLVESFGWRIEQVVAEVNGEAVPRAEMRAVALGEGDRVEIVRAVAGG